MINNTRIFAIIVIFISVVFSGCATISKTLEGGDVLNFDNPPKDLAVYEGPTLLEFENYNWSREDFTTKGLTARLDARLDHTLLLTGDYKETTIQTRSGMEFRWIWANGLFGPAAPIGIAVDAYTGRWKGFKDRIDVSEALKNARSTVCIAVEKKDREKVKKIITLKPIALNRRDNDGKTPLHTAIKQGNAEMVQLLLEFKPNLNTKDNEGQTPLQMALALESRNPGKYNKIVELLQANSVSQ